MELLSSVTKTPIRYSPNHAELLMLLMHNINLLIISVSIYIAEVQKNSNFVKYEANFTCALYKKPGNPWKIYYFQTSKTDMHIQPSVLKKKNLMYFRLWRWMLVHRLYFRFQQRNISIKN